jgi:hypothetical protein
MARAGLDSDTNAFLYSFSMSKRVLTGFRV